jgi:cell cycle checkpoint protein
MPRVTESGEVHDGAAAPAGAGNAGNENGRVLSARLENVRLLSDALSCIYSSSRKTQDVVLSVPASGGLKFAVEQAGCLMASVLLPLGAFASFKCDDSSTRIRLNLSLLLDCLNIFAVPGASADRGPVPVRIAYDGEGHPLGLLFQEQDAVTVCQLNTIDNDYTSESDFQFMAHKVHNMTLLQSEALRDAIAELDYAGATTAELHLGPVAPRFKFQSPASIVVEAGESDSDNERTPAAEYAEPQCAVELPDPSDVSTGVFAEFKSERAQTSSYSLELLQRCSKALALSETCKVQMNTEGMLSVVCRMRPGMASASAHGRPGGSGGGGEHCFCEFIIVANEIEVDGLAPVGSSAPDAILTGV